MLHVVTIHCHAALSLNTGAQKIDTKLHGNGSCMILDACCVVCAMSSMVQLPLPRSFFVAQCTSFSDGCADNFCALHVACSSLMNVWMLLLMNKNKWPE